MFLNNILVAGSLSSHCGAYIQTSNDTSELRMDKGFLLSFLLLHCPSFPLQPPPPSCLCSVLLGPRVRVWDAPRAVAMGPAHHLLAPLAVAGLLEAPASGLNGQST